VVQDAREVRTKFSKTFTTCFFPVGEDIRQIVVDWVDYLISHQLFGPADPLFPATQVVQDADYQFQAGGLSRQHWSNATPIRMIFREAFAGAGLAYANPHSFRKTLAQLVERPCRTPEEFRAWSQNLGHEQVLTTFSSYGEVAADRQAELIRRLAQRRESGTPKAEMIDRMIQVLQDGKHTFE
jgi:integrase